MRRSWDLVWLAALGLLVAGVVEYSHFRSGEALQKPSQPSQTLTTTDPMAFEVDGVRLLMKRRDVELVAGRPATVDRNVWSFRSDTAGLRRVEFDARWLTFEVHGFQLRACGTPVVVVGDSVSVVEDVFGASARCIAAGDSTAYRYPPGMIRYVEVVCRDARVVDVALKTITRLR